MKKLLISLSFLVIAVLSYGQAHDGLVEFQNVPRAAAVIELPYTTDIVNSAMNDYLSKKGKAKGSDIKGFNTYRNTQAQQTDSANADLYFRVERKSRKEKQITILSLLLTTSQDVTPPNTNVHYLSMDEAKSFLNTLTLAISAYDLELQIKEQNQVVTKSESKYQSLVKHGSDLDKKRIGIENDIIENKQDQRNQTTEMELQKQKLAALVNLRKP
jgi:hypothetical protein